MPRVFRIVQPFNSSIRNVQSEIAEVQNYGEGPGKTHSALAYRRGFSMISSLKVTRKPACLTEMRLDRLNDHEEHHSQYRLDFELSIPGSPLVPIRDIHIDLPSYLEDIQTDETTNMITTT